MPKRSTIEPTTCPIAVSADLIGDRWTLLILRELFFGAHRFENLQRHTGAAPQMLTDRLRRLEKNEVIQRSAYQQRPVRYEYRLTEKGKDLFSILYAMRNWAERWCRDGDAPLAIAYVHRACGADVGLNTICPSCGATLGYGDLKGTPSSEIQKERFAKQRQRIALAR
jgi:DNA-binding HxlR family transcriptional regulator